MRRTLLGSLAASLLVHIVWLYGAGSIDLLPPTEPGGQVDDLPIDIRFVDALPIETVVEDTIEDIVEDTIKDTIPDAIAEEIPAPEPPAAPSESPPAAEAVPAPAEAPAAATNSAMSEVAPATATPETPSNRPHRGKRRVRKQPAPSEPCPVSPEGIVAVAATNWRIDRDLIDYYATHIGELMKLGNPYSHKGTDGRPDGFRVGIPRCSLLRDGGLRSGDIVKDINGVRINTVLQAIGAYFKLRDEPVLQVRVERRRQEMVLSYDIEQKDRRGRPLAEPGDYAAAGMLHLHAEATAPEPAAPTTTTRRR